MIPEVPCQGEIRRMEQMNNALQVFNFSVFEIPLDQCVFIQGGRVK
jgi:hypothetical protein